VRTFIDPAGYEGVEYAGEVAFTPDGDWLVWSFSNEGDTLWEVGTGRKVGQLDGNPNASALGFSTDGKWLAGEANTKLYLWQRQN
jgi:hypothetical protein